LGGGADIFGGSEFYVTNELRRTEELSTREGFAEDIVYYKHAFAVMQPNPRFFGVSYSETMVLELGKGNGSAYRDRNMVTPAEIGGNLPPNMETVESNGIVSGSVDGIMKWL
jgi:hypothetical protein